ncbi:MAG: hypothetical protein GWP19_11760 [Planctomycetia bacterium]|nr:hypothetical protein [Planctomycetia bacterium]
MPNRKVKELNDREKMSLITDFMQKTFKDKDKYFFDFEADFEKIYKQLNVNKLVNNDKAYLKKFTDMIVSMYRQIYLKEVITAGLKQKNRFLKAFTEAA